MRRMYANGHVAAPQLPPTGAEPLSPGSEISPGFRVVSLLRRGRDLDTYDLWSESRRCRCVGKTVRDDRADGDRVALRLQQEGSLLQELSHPHIVRCYEVVLEPRPLVVLETLPGETLGRLIGRQQRLVFQEVLILGLQLCSAVGYLHHRNVLHLDLKPSNVVASNGLAKVLDLSVARGIGISGGPSGTRGYRAPEQLAPGTLSAASDVWGLGVNLFEVLTGFPAWWEGSTPKDPATLREPFTTQSVRTFRPVPASLASLLDRCLAHDANCRPSVDELVHGLDALLPEASVVPATNVDPGLQP